MILWPIVSSSQACIHALFHLHQLHYCLFQMPGVISVVDELDYEQQQQYELLIRATDSVSGIYAEVPVSVAVQDVNDCPPEFLQDSYNVSVSEAAPFGTAVLKVMVKDNDTGILN